MGLFVLIGGLIPTIIVSRLTLMTLPKRYRHDAIYISGAHIASLLICALLYGFGSGEGGFEPRLANMFGVGFVAGFITYLLPQAFWAACDIWRSKKRMAAQIAEANDK